MRDGTDCANLLRAYVGAWPRDIGGYKDGARLGFKFHTQSQRSGELGSKHGFPCVSRRREGEDYHEYRFKDRATFERARLQVKAWDMGMPVATLAAQESLRPVRQEALALAGGGA